MESCRIVGIVLVRNEDFFVRQAVRNISEFCDTLLLCDHQSTDGTSAILAECARDLPKASFHRIEHPRESHELIRSFAGTPTWVFGVDGDEVYDPQGLAAFRHQLLKGECDRVWRIKGNVVHCVSLDLAGRRARGYFSPPSRSITKLYNFAAIESWNGASIERLHGGVIRFREGWNDAMKRNIQDEISWERSSLRCLHLCFLRRSTNEKPGAKFRENIMELHEKGFVTFLRKVVGRLSRQETASRWKRDHYRRGAEGSVETGAFFPE